MSQMEQQVARMGEREQACAEYLVHVIAAGLADAYRVASGGSHETPTAALTPEPLPEGVTWEAVYRLARQNSVEALAWRGAGVRASEMPEGLRKNWAGEADGTLWRRLQFDVERERVIAAAEQAGFSLLPLKGVLTATYYPEPGLRSMADNDILYGRVEPIPEGEEGYPGFRMRGSDAAAREQTVAESMRDLKRVMEGLGYKATHVGTGNHDNYEKKPCFNFEMHRKLASSSNTINADADWSVYYANPWRRAIQGKDDPRLFHFSDEDEYLFHIAHAFKHFDTSGCGVRCAADEAVFLKAKGADMDWGYIAGELEKLGMTAFEDDLRHAALAAFPTDGGPLPGASLSELSAADRTFLLYLLGSGVYGNRQTLVERRMERIAGENGSGSAGASAKFTYIRERLCPSGRVLKENHPFFYRHPVLRPLLAVGRVVKAATIKLPRAASELKLLIRR